MAGGSLEMTPEQGWGKTYVGSKKTLKIQKTQVITRKKNWKTLRVLRKKTRKKPLRQK